MKGVMSGGIQERETLAIRLGETLGYVRNEGKKGQSKSWCLKYHDETY